MNAIPNAWEEPGGERPEAPDDPEVVEIVVVEGDDARGRQGEGLAATSALSSQSTKRQGIHTRMATHTAAKRRALSSAMIRTASGPTAQPQRSGAVAAGPPEHPVQAARAVAVDGLPVVVAAVVTGQRAVVPVEDDSDGLRGVDQGERLLDEPSWRLVSADHQEEAVDEPGQHTAVRDGDERRRVDDDRVVALARGVQERHEARGLEELVRRLRDAARRHDVEVELRARVDDGLEAERGLEDRVHQARQRAAAGGAQSERAGDARPAQVRVDQEHPRAGALSQRAGQIDGRDGLAVPDRGARHRDAGRAVHRPARLDQVAKRAILLGLEAGGRQQTHQVARRRRRPARAPGATGHSRSGAPAAPQRPTSPPGPMPGGS